MILQPSTNTRRQNLVNHHPPVVDIKYKANNQFRGRPRDSYSIGTNLYNIDALDSYIYGPVEWLGIFAHAPNNVYQFAYTYEVGDKSHKFTPAYFKGDGFSIENMCSYLKYGQDNQKTVYQGFSKERSVIINGPILRNDDIYTFLKIVYFGRKNNFAPMNLFEFIRLTTKTSNTDDFYRRLFHICNLAKTTLATKEENALPEMPLFSLKHSSSNDSFFDALLKAASQDEARAHILTLCKESTLDFDCLGIEASYARRIGRGKNNNVTYTGHMTRFYDPDTKIRLSTVPDLLSGTHFTFNEAENLFEKKLELSTIRLLSAFVAHLPGHSEKTGDLEKTFNLESLLCLSGKRSDLLSKRSDLVKNLLALTSAFFGKIIIHADTLKIFFGICAQGVKISKISQKIDDGLAEIKKLIKDRVKGSFQKIRQSIFNVVNIDPLDKPARSLPREDVSSSREKELSDLLILFKDKYQPLVC